MKLEECKNCTYHSDYIQGHVHCHFWGTNINSVATYVERSGTVYAVSCMKDK